MKTKIFFAALIISIFNIMLNAQTPIVLTLKASGVSSTETPEGSTYFSVSATLNGAVNANGTNCTVSFEYGNTTSYGNSIAANPANVTGDYGYAVNATVTINYTYNGLLERLIHYRVKVTNENGTYYGRDFIAVAIDPTRNIAIMATCNPSPTMANYDIMNRNLFDVVVDYTDHDSFTESIIIGNYQVTFITINKNSTCEFTYHYRVFTQLRTNDQTCAETQLTKQLVSITSTGKIASDKMMYRIENGNTIAVDIEVLCGSTYYSYTIAPQSVAYVVASNNQAQISISGYTFVASEPSTYSYEGLAWLLVTPLTFTATTADFELYNRDDAAHTFVFRNAGGTENSYTLAAYESRTITLANENWSVYTTVWDPTGMNYGPPHNNIYTGPVFGDAAYYNNGLLKVATAIPGSSIVPNVVSSSVTSSTSITLNGTITNNAFTDESVDYHFVYGTDPGNLNQSTSTQNSSVSAQHSVNVNTTLTGLTAETIYYFKLVAATIQSSAKKIFLSTVIPTTNLKLHLRSDLAVTSSSSAVSSWGDVSGFDNDASQSTSANQPTLVSNSMNGNPVIRFDGTNSKLTLPTSATLGIQSNPYEMFVVGKSSSSNVQFLVSGNANENFEYHLNGVGARFIPIASIFLDLGTAATYSDGNAHIFSARASSSGGAVRVDGTDGGTSSANILSSNSGALQLGVRSDGTYYFNGDIAEVILYNTVLSGADRSTVEHYLANRYGITSGALPVELTSFSAECKGQSVELKWTTATEVNNYGFNVECRMNNEEWETIGFIQGNGNSNSPKEYSFVDENPPTGNLKYRLKQIDTDGNYEYYSTIAEISFSPTGVNENELPKEFALLQNYPNPFNPVTVISWQLPASSQVTLKVYDILGNEVATLVDEQKAPGNYEVKFDGSRLASGTYIYRLKADNFSQTRKLLLMK